MNFQEKLKQIRELVGLDENVKSLLEKMTGKELVSYEGIDALVAALMGFYNNELNKKINKIDNIAELQLRKNLKVGDIVEVLGYYTAGDGATHKRVITNKDDGSGVQLNNGLWANIVHNGEVNVSWFGAKGDGVSDDTSYFQKALDYSKNTIFTGEYLVSGLNIKSGYRLSGTERSKSKLLPYNGNSILILRTVNYAKLQNFTINGVHHEFKARCGIDIDYMQRNSILDNIWIESCETGIKLERAWTNSFSNIYLWKCGIGLQIDSINQTDYAVNNTLFENISCQFCDIGIKFPDTLGSQLLFKKLLIENNRIGIEINVGYGAIKFDGVYAELNSEYDIIQKGKINCSGILEINNLYSNSPNCENPDKAPIVIENIRTVVISGISTITKSGYSAIKIKDSGSAFINVTVESSLELDVTTPWFEVNSQNKIILPYAGDRYYSTRNNMTFDEIKIYKNLSFNEPKMQYNTDANYNIDFIIKNASDNIERYYFKVGKKDPNSLYNNQCVMLNAKTKAGEIIDILTLSEDTATLFGNKILVETQMHTLNTFYYGEKMKEEGVYNDFITYMDEKTAYDKQQKKLEQDRQLSYEEALKENPELTYEEFLSMQPMTLNLIASEEPQPGKALLDFMKKYL